MGVSLACSGDFRVLSGWNARSGGESHWRCCGRGNLTFVLSDMGRLMRVLSGGVMDSGVSFQRLLLAPEESRMEG